MDPSSAHDARLRNARKAKMMKREKVKVVYVSTPLKVRTCASKFRALVQELTGKDSDIFELAETSGGNYLDSDHISPREMARESPTSSDSAINPRFDVTANAFITQSTLEKDSLGIFPSDFYFGSCDHVLGNDGIMSYF